MVEGLGTTMSAEPVLGGKFGFFSRPVLARGGPYAGRVVKSYKAVRSLSRCKQLCEHHRWHLRQLSEIGIQVPPTEMVVEQLAGKWRPLIIQHYFRPEEMVRARIASGELDESLRLMTGLLDDALRAITYVQKTGDCCFGFHPTLRNYAIRGAELFYLDTFPPMSGFTRNELAEVILEFVPRGLPGFLKLFGRPYLKTVLDEYFRADVMLLGVVGSTCRLRPQDHGRIMEAARTFVAETAPFHEQQRVLHKLAKAPRLGPLWMMGRRYFERVRERMSREPSRQG